VTLVASSRKPTAPAPCSAPDGADVRLERRYLALVRLARDLAQASDWKALAAAISRGLGEGLAAPPDEPPAVRLWAITSEGFEELARHPPGREFAHSPARALHRAAELGEPAESPGGGVLVGLHAGGMSLGVLEVDESASDAELIGHAAPLIAGRVSLLAGQGTGDVMLAPLSVEGASDAGWLMAAFASEAKRQLDHDRLSAYLLTCEGRAFERFAVATSPIVPGEGVVIPFHDVGLRHVVISNRALVSRDIGNDPRIVGREDRVIARAGFHGLLSVPLRLQGRPIGVLNFVSRTPGFYSDEDVPIAEQIADQVAAFVGNLHVQQRMRTLIRHEATEQERTRLARDLYHAVAQTVPAIERIGEELRDHLAVTDPRAGERAAQVARLAEQTLTEVRRAVADVVPRGLDSHSLEEAIRATLGQLGPGDPVATLDVEGDTSALSGAVRRGAYRIFQEALTNARLHADARRVTVRLCSDRDLVLTVQDDGAGFNPLEAGRRTGLGLEFMAERAQAFGGRMDVESAPGDGTTVRFELLGARDASEHPHGAEEPFEPRGASATSLRVFVAEPNNVMRAGFVALVAAASDMRVVGDAATAEQARGQIRRLRPDVVLIDARLADGETEQVVQELRTHLPEAGILVMSERCNGRRAALEEAGASGVLHKLADGAELIEAVRAVASGASFVSSEPPITSGGTALSQRERSILALVAAGQTNTEIGKTLFLATKTVERQVATIVRKLGARNRAHAAAIAAARQIVDPGDF
jgi:signal transduction histidine kinase/DNA-binding NarL/FixJ family response regulator